MAYDEANKEEIVWEILLLAYDAALLADFLYDIGLRRAANHMLAVNRRLVTAEREVQRYGRQREAH